MEEAIRLSLKDPQQQVLDLSKSPPAAPAVLHGQRTQVATPAAMQRSAPSQGAVPAPHAAAAATMAVDDSEEDRVGQEAPHARSRRVLDCTVHNTWEMGSCSHISRAQRARGDACHPLCRRTQAVLDSEDGDGGEEGGSSSSIDSQAVDQDSGSEFAGGASGGDDGDSSSEGSDLEEEEDHEPTPKKARKVACLQLTTSYTCCCPINVCIPCSASVYTCLLIAWQGPAKPTGKAGPQRASAPASSKGVSAKAKAGAAAKRASSAVPPAHPAPLPAKAVKTAPVAKGVRTDINALLYPARGCHVEARSWKPWPACVPHSHLLCPQSSGRRMRAASLLPRSLLPWSSERVARLSLWEVWGRGQRPPPPCKHPAASQPPQQKLSGREQWQHLQ